MKSFSIIIPAYNAENHISRCLESCLKQVLSHENYEIIIVNDGSKDNTLDIIKNYQKTNENIIVIEQNNEGVSSARNKGISIANGEYLLFVDADDTIKENSLSSILAHLNKSQNDLTILNSVLFKNGNRLKSVYAFPSHLTNKTVSGEKLFLEKYLRGSVCGVVFKRNFLKKYHLNFPKDVKNGEDAMFMTFCFLHAKNIQHFNVDFYKVNIREESASRSWSLQKVRQMLSSVTFLEEFLVNQSLTNTQKAMLSIKAYGIISNSLYYFFSLNKLNDYPEIKSMIKRSKIYPIKTFGVNHFKYKILLLNSSINLFCLPFFFRQQFYNIIKLLRTN